MTGYTLTTFDIATLVVIGVIVAIYAYWWNK